MKKAKVFMSFFICAVLLIITCVPCFAEESEEGIIKYSPTEVNEMLISGGCPEKLTQKLSENALLKITENIGEYTVTDIVCTVGGFAKVNGKTDENIKADIIILELRDVENGYYNGYTVCVFWEGVKKPFLNQNDVVYVTWNTEKFLPDYKHFYAEDLRLNAESGKWSVHKTYNRVDESSYNGTYNYGYRTDLLSPKDGVGGVVIFNIVTQSYSKQTSITETGVNVHYGYNFLSKKTIIPSAVILSVVAVTIVIRKKRKNKIKKT